MIKGTTIVFVIEGSVSVADVRAEKLGTLMIEPRQNENDILILPSSNSKYVLITIF